MQYHIIKNERLWGIENKFDIYIRYPGHEKRSFRSLWTSEGFEIP